MYYAEIEYDFSGAFVQWTAKVTIFRKGAVMVYENALFLAAAIMTYGDRHKSVITKHQGLRTIAINPQ